jgi:poly(A) polymerase
VWEQLFFVQPKIYFASEHDIDHSMIDPDALFILSRLRDAGYIAYLVGGSVRDLLVKKTPKDFDISTSARPEQLKSLFHRNCILIGRRFRLAHIRLGHKIFEVSTFRSGDTADSDLILHDNQWGTPEQDVLRRDFTINGLFYDPSNHSVIDYVGGWEDIHKHILRSIGEPEARFRQDPVRMIRLLKFRARFGFEIAEDSRKALVKCRNEIIKSSPARILEEILRMLESGAAAPFFKLMKESGLLMLLFPALNKALQSYCGGQIYQFLTAADKINLTNIKNPLDRPILTSCLLFPMLEEKMKTEYLNQGLTPHVGEITLTVNSLINNAMVASFSHFPRRLSSSMSFILTTQYRLIPLSGKRHVRPKLFSNKEFDLAMKFLKIRALLDEGLVDSYVSWKDHYRAHDRHGKNHHYHHSKRPHT